MKLPNELKHGDFTYIPIDRITPNAYNPNIMDETDFAMLEDNISKVGFLDPILVVPIFEDAGEIHWEIVDGEHRYQMLRVENEIEAPCIVVDPDIFDEKTRKLQTVRMNKIRGSFDIGKFNALVNNLVKEHNIPFDDISNELGFVDEDEFQQLVGELRKSVPKGARKEYDKAVKSADSIQDVYRIVEKLWKRYGDTLPSNFMILDFGRKRHLWVTLKSRALYEISDIFREVMAAGYTIDSYLVTLLKEIDPMNFIDDFKHKMTKIPEGDTTKLDDLVEESTEESNE